MNFRGISLSFFFCFCVQAVDFSIGPLLGPNVSRPSDPPKGWTADVSPGYQIGFGMRLAPSDHWDLEADFFFSQRKAKSGIIFDTFSYRFRAVELVLLGSWTQAIGDVFGIRVGGGMMGSYGLMKVRADSTDANLFSEDINRSDDKSYGALGFNQHMMALVVQGGFDWQTEAAVFTLLLRPSIELLNRSRNGAKGSRLWSVSVIGGVFF